jgi:hypothetical protein
VLKRLLVHASGFNLGLWMRRLFGIGTPRALQGRAVAFGAVLSLLCSLIDEAIAPIRNESCCPVPSGVHDECDHDLRENTTCTTAC